MASSDSRLVPAATPDLTLKKVRDDSAADPLSVKVTLFKASENRICGWYIGPVSIKSTGVGLAYLAPSTETMASVAVVRALAAAAATHTDVCIVDPDDLWDPAWNA